MAAPALALEAVTKAYGREPAVDGVTLALAPGERLALLGHNGAGKTTLLKLALGLTRPDGGRVTTLGTAARKPGLDPGEAGHRLPAGECGLPGLDDRA